MLHLWPRRFLHGEPMPIRLEPPVGQPLRFVLFARDEPDDFLVQSRWCGIDFDVRVEPVFVFLFDQAFDGFSCRAHVRVVSR